MVTKQGLEDVQLRSESVTNEQLCFFCLITLSQRYQCFCNTYMIHGIFISAYNTVIIHPQCRF